MSTVDTALTPKEMQALVSGEFVRGHFRLIVITLTLALQGCITAPKLDPQQQMMSSERLGLAAQVSTPMPVQAWWSAFNDPQLDQLMRQALADNPSLVQAMARV